MREALKVVLFQFLSYGLQVLFMLAAARELGPELQGRYAILRAATYLIETFMWLGLTSAVSYFVARNFDKFHDALVIASMAYLACAVALTLPVVLLVLPVFGVPSDTGLMIVAWVVSLALLQFFLKVFLGQQRYMLYNGINILTSVTLFVPFVVLWLRHDITLSHVVYCNVTANCVGLVAAVVAHRHHLRHIDISRPIRGLLPEFYAVGLRGYASSVIFLALLRADFFFVGYFYPSSLGPYSLAVFVVEGVQKVADWLGMVLSPKVSAGLDRDGEITRRFARSAVLFVLAVSLVLGAFAAVNFDYLVVALGPKYHGVELIVLALMPKAAIQAIVAIYGGRLAGRGYTIYHPLAGLLALITLVAFDSLLVGEFALSAAIVGITLAYAVAAAVTVYGTRRVGPGLPLHVDG